MKQPDKFEKMVESQRLAAIMSLLMLLKVPTRLGNATVLRTDDAVKLLRRQHAAYVRLVKGRRPVTKDKNPLTPYGEAYQMLCDDLLAEFERYRKGKP